MSDYVSIPLAEVERSREAHAACGDILRLIAHLSTDPADVRDKAEECDNLANLLNEAISAGLDAPCYMGEVTAALVESETRNTALQGLLTDVVGTVGEYLGRSYVADPQGCEAAMKALREAVQCLAPPVDDRKAWLALMCEASRALPLVVNIEIGDYASTSKGGNGGGWRSIELIPDVPVSRIPTLNESLALDDGRRVRVLAPPEHVGVSAVLRCRILSTPKPVDDF